MIGSKLQEQLAHKLQIITEAYLQLPVTLECLLLQGTHSLVQVEQTQHPLL